MNLLQEHPRAATVGVILVGMAVAGLLYLLSTLNSETDKTPASTSTGVEGTQEAGSSAVDGQYGESGGAAPSSGSEDYTGLAGSSAGLTQEAAIDIDIDSDGKLETIVLFRGQGEERLLDWYLVDDGSAAESVLFERRGVLRGLVTVDGPRIIETEAVYAAGDDACCPSESKRTLYVWKDGGLEVSRVEAAPPGAPVP